MWLRTPTGILTLGPRKGPTSRFARVSLTPPALHRCCLTEETSYAEPQTHSAESVSDYDRCCSRSQTGNPWSYWRSTRTRSRIHAAFVPIFHRRFQAALDRAEIFMLKRILPVTAILIAAID